MKRSIVLFLVALFLAAAAPAADSYVPTDAERARWTMFDMMSWRTALQAYASDNGHYPDVTTLEAARDAVQPLYIRTAPMHDAWGHPYRFEKTATGFRLISAGSDGVFQPDTWATGGQQESLNADAVVTNEGKWVFRSWVIK